MTSAVFNARAVHRCTVVLPRWGVWWAEIWTAREDDVLAGEARLAIGQLDLRGTIVHGGAVRGAAIDHYLVVGGANGWGKPIAEQAYRGGLGVKLSTVVKDAATAAGEKLAPIVDRRIGPAFLHAAGLASEVLDAVAPEDWYVDEAGVTHLGARAPFAYEKPYTLVSERKDRGYAVVHTDDLRSLTPGAQITGPLEGFTVASVRHELSTEGIATHLWALDESLGDRWWNAIARIVRKVIRPTWFHGAYEYRVTSCDGGYCDVKPAAAGLGLPPISNVPVRVGIPGAIVDVQIGTTVLLAFVNGDPTRPFLAGYEGESGGGWLPISTGLDASIDVKLGQALGRVLRSGDKVIIPGVQPGPGVTGILIALDPTVTALPGAPGVGRSKVLS